MSYNIDDAIFGLISGSATEAAPDEQIPIDQIKKYLCERSVDPVTALKIGRLICENKANLAYFKEVGEDIHVDMQQIPEVDLRNAYNSLQREKAATK